MPEFDLVVLGGGPRVGSPPARWPGLAARWCWWRPGQPAGNRWPWLLAGGAATGPYTEEWMAEVVLAISAGPPLSVPADVVHAFPACGEAIGHPARELTIGHWKGIGSLMSESDLEKPVPDFAEQQRDAAEDPEDLPMDEPASLPFDVNEADAVEQHLEVELDEDDYR